MHVMSGVISLKDNATATLRAVRKEQSAFKREVDNTKKSLTKTWDKKYKARLDATAASKKAKQLSKQYAPLRKKIATAVAVKDIATSKIKAVGSRLKSIGKTVTSPVVKLKDKASSALKSLSGKLKSIGKAVAIPIAAGGAAAVAGVGATVKSGMELEQQQVSMEHFVGATNKGMSQDQVKATTDKYIAALRDNANTTPFETGEVIQAGSRAIAIANGNTKEAMSLVTLAEDMAAASGGTKSVSGSRSLGLRSPKNNLIQRVSAAWPPTCKIFTVGPQISWQPPARASSPPSRASSKALSRTRASRWSISSSPRLRA